MTINAAFETFMAQDFEDAVVSSTTASWGGSGFSVELFEDGSYRVLWTESIGNRYDSAGLILAVPELGDDEWDGEEGEHYFDNAREYMYGIFENAMEVYGIFAYAMEAASEAESWD